MKLIFISGPSGSGKTTLSKNILLRIKNGTVLSTDNYYKTGLVSKLLSKVIDGYFDRRISLDHSLLKKDLRFIIENGYSNYVRFYDFKSKSINKIKIKTKNVKFLIVEGIFAKDFLNGLNENDSFFIELKKNKNYCMQKVIKRDFKERGKEEILAKKDFLKSWDIYYCRFKNKSLKKQSVEFILKKNSDIDKILKKIF
tara:strand:+ start:323 stop:916 length:594 start_codon:yes stop_codon:yes gene_type:complete